VAFLNQLALLRQFVWRHARLHPLIALLNIASIALGVSVYLAVQVANHSASRAFGASIDLVSGKSQIEVRGADGNLADNVFPLVRSHAGVSGATPVIQGYAILPDRPGEYLQILGIDLFSHTPFQTAEITPGGSGGIGAGGLEWISKPNQILITEGYSRSHDLEIGDLLSVQIDGQTFELEVAMIRSTEGLDSATSDRIAMMDIGWMQELLGRAGRVDSIQVALAEDAEIDSVQESLRNVLPPGTVVQTPAQRSGQISTMLKGFQLNLTALSMVSILVGVFLIYNTAAASVVRRRKEIGTLRSTGASRGTIRRLFLSEAAMYAILGILIGIPLGLFLSKLFLARVTGVISIHYILVHAADIFANPLHILQAIGYGLLASLVGAWMPANEAASIPPAEALRPVAISPGSPRRRRPLLQPILGLFCLVGAAIFSGLSLETIPPMWSFAACFLVVAGFALLIPTAMLTLAKVLRGVAQVRPALALAVDNLSRALHRNSMTASALMASIAMMVGVSIMVGSFRTTVDLWMQQTVVADIFVAPAANETLGLVAYLDPAVKEVALGIPGVVAADSFREVDISTDEANFGLSVIGGPPRDNLPLMRPSPEADAGQWQEIGKALVNEPFMRRFGIAEGDTVTLPTPSGDVVFSIIGVFYDYADNQGKVAISKASFDHYWDDPRYHSLALYLEPGTDPEAVCETLRERFSQQGELSIYANSELRQKVFEIFEQTFAVTYVLRSIAIAVALAGIILTLTTLVRERIREIAVLRAIGGSRGQVAASYMTEAGLIGLCSAIVGVVCGIALSVVLTWVVNLAFFGWTIRFVLPWSELVPIPIWVTAVGALAGIIPAWIASRADPAPALREL